MAEVASQPNLTHNKEFIDGYPRFTSHGQMSTKPTPAHNGTTVTICELLLVNIRVAALLFHDQLYVVVSMSNRMYHML